MFQNNSKFRLCKLLSFYLFCLGTHGTKLRNFGENSDMTERKKKSFRPSHYKRGTESFVCFLVRVHSWFSSGVPERNAGSEEILEQCWQRHSKPE